MKYYFPILKTTDSELRAFEELSSKSKSQIIPIFELTRSRKTKSSPNGDVAKKMDRVADLMGARPFILDLCAHETMINDEIESLLESDKGFLNWRMFLEDYAHLNIIPLVHLDVYDLAETTALTNALLSMFEYLAVRFELGEGEDGYPETYEIQQCLAALNSANPGLAKFKVIFDGGYLNDKNRQQVFESMEMAVGCIGDYTPSEIIIASSSFPKSVASHGENFGRFEVYEEFLTRDIGKLIKVSHGDYASIHPIRYQTGGGGWIPRIDVYCEDMHFFYHRVRREHGGYVVAAERVFKDKSYKPFDCWGHSEIMLAHLGEPSGISPAFWIAVRANIYMSLIVRKLNPR